MVNGSWHDTSVLVIGGGPGHGKGLTGSRLPIAHNGSIVATHNLGDCLFGAVVKDILLGGVMQNLIKFESPILLLVIDHALLRIFWDVHSHGLQMQDVSYV